MAKNGIDAAHVRLYDRPWAASSDKKERPVGRPSAADMEPMAGLEPAT